TGRRHPRLERQRARLVQLQPFSGGSWIFAAPGLCLPGEIAADHAVAFEQRRSGIFVRSTQAVRERVGEAVRRRRGCRCPARSRAGTERSSNAAAVAGHRFSRSAASYQIIDTVVSLLNNNDILTSAFHSL